MDSNFPFKEQLRADLEDRLKTLAQNWRVSSDENNSDPRIQIIRSICMEEYSGTTATGFRLARLLNNSGEFEELRDYFEGLKSPNYSLKPIKGHDLSVFHDTDSEHGDYGQAMKTIRNFIYSIGDKVIKLNAVHKKRDPSIVNQWMNTGLIPTDAIVIEGAVSDPSHDDSGYPTIPPVLVNELFGDFQQMKLQADQHEIGQLLEHGSAEALDALIKYRLLPELKKTRAEIKEKLQNVPDDENLGHLLAGDLKAHEEFLSNAILNSRAKINAAPQASFTEITLIEKPREFPAIGIDPKNIPTLTIEVSKSELPNLFLKPYAAHENKRLSKMQSDIMQEIESRSGNDLKNYYDGQLKPAYIKLKTDIDAAKSRGHGDAPHMPAREVQLSMLQKLSSHAIRKMVDEVNNRIPIIQSPTPEPSTEKVKSALAVETEPQPKPETFSLSKIWGGIRNNVKRGVAVLTLAFGGVAFAPANAPEAPDAPQPSPAAVTAVSETPTPIAITPPVAPVAAAEPVAKSKPVNLAKKSFAPVVNIEDTKPIIEKSFDIAEFRPNISSLIAACKQAGDVKTGGVCESVKSFEMK